MIDGRVFEADKDVTVRVVPAKQRPSVVIPELPAPKPVETIPTPEGPAPKPADAIPKPEGPAPKPADAIPKPESPAPKLPAPTPEGPALTRGPAATLLRPVKD